MRPLKAGVIPKESPGRQVSTKPPFEKFGQIWRIPWAPGQQPRARVESGPSTPTTQTGPTLAQAIAELEGAMTLLFTCASNDPRLSRASCSTPRAGTMIFRRARRATASATTRVIEVGETIRGAFKVVEIGHEWVKFLVRNSIVAPLNYSDAARPNAIATGNQVRSKSDEILDRLRGSQDERPSGELPFVARATVPETGVVVVTDDEWVWYEQNGERLSREIGLAPHLDRKSGKVDGIELTDVPATSIVSKRGLAQGDVIKSVNGDPVTDMSQVGALAAKHKNATVLTIVYVRRGIEQTVTIKRGGK